MENNNVKFYGVIYKLTSPSDKCYIGQTVNLYQRMNRYKNLKCKGQPKLLNALSQYGFDNFKLEILKECSTLEELNQSEEFFISHYNSINEGYNCFAGGNNKRHTEESKEKLRKSKLGTKLSEETKLKIKEKMKGRIISEETKKKMSASLRLRVCKEETRKKHSENNKNKIKSPKFTRKGIKNSEEARRKMSISQRLRTDKRKPIIFTDEIRKKISESKIGIPLSDITRQKIGKSNCDPTIYKFKNIKTGEEFVGIKNEFKNRHKIGYEAINNHIKGKTKKCKGWVLVKEDVNINNLDTNI